MSAVPLLYINTLKTLAYKITLVIVLSKNAANHYRLIYTVNLQAGVIISFFRFVSGHH